MVNIIIELIIIIIPVIFIKVGMRIIKNLSKKNKIKHWIVVTAIYDIICITLIPYTLMYILDKFIS